MKLRRDFTIEKGDKVLIVEDVLTTGGSINEVSEIVIENNGKVTGVGVVVDRSGGNIKLHNNQLSVMEHYTTSFAKNDIPEYLTKIPIQKPGSRNIS